MTVSGVPWPGPKAYRALKYRFEMLRLDWAGNSDGHYLLGGGPHALSIHMLALLTEMWVKNVSVKIKGIS